MKLPALEAIVVPRPLVAIMAELYAMLAKIVYWKVELGAAAADAVPKVTSNTTKVLAGISSELFR